MIEVISKTLMQESDKHTIETKVPAEKLVKRAAEGIFLHISDLPGSFALVCGSGNNGADGYALALILSDAGRKCRVFSVGKHYTKECSFYKELCSARGLCEDYNEQTSFDEYDNIVDCLIGVGFSGSIKPEAAEIINKINSSGKYVISADINSGLEADSGLSELCVRSDLTAAIEYPKPGHYLGMAKDVISSLKIAKIGIEAVGRTYKLIEKEDVKAVLGSRANYSHKGNYGYIALIGGCMNYSGAVKLANISASAMRSGAGVVKLAVPSSIAGAVAPYLLESTLFPLEDNNGSFAFKKEQIDLLLSNVKAAAVGMGWGQDGDNHALLSYVLENFALPLVIDADGLNTLAKGDIGLLKKTKCRVVLTPHLMEFSRLSGLSVNEISAEPIKHAEKFASEYGVILLLKGTSTIITDGSETYITNTGCPGMATAGSGDVLSGMIAGMLGYLPPSALTVACAAYINGLAGELAEKEQTSVSMTAGDTARSVADAVKAVIG